MHYWRLLPRLNAVKPTFLFVSDFGIGTLTVRRRRIGTALRRLRAGDPIGDSFLMPSHLLLRIRSCANSRSITARLHRGRSRRFFFRSVAARDEFMATLRGHPAVVATKIGEQQLIDRLRTWVGYYVAFVLLGLLAYYLGVSVRGALGVTFFLSVGSFFYWGSGRRPEVEEVLFE